MNITILPAISVRCCASAAILTHYKHLFITMVTGHKRQVSRVATDIHIVTIVYIR